MVMIPLYTVDGGTMTFATASDLGRIDPRYLKFSRTTLLEYWEAGPVVGKPHNPGNPAGLQKTHA